MANNYTNDRSLVVANQKLTLGQSEFLRTDDGTATLNVNGLPAGAATVLWNGTGASDTGGDWTASQDGSETVGSMRSGTNGWDSGVRGNNDNTRFSNGAEIDVAALYGTLSFWFNPQLKEGNTDLEVQFYKAGTLVNNRLNIANYVTNFDIGVWQKVTIPISDFGLTETVDQFRLLYEAQGPKTQHYYFDDIEFTAVGGGGPYVFQVASPDVVTRYHLSMMVLVMSAPSAGWNSTNFCNLAALTSGLLLRQRKISTAEILWSINSKDNSDLFGRFHPQDDIEFADGTLLVGFMIKPGKASIVITDDDVLEIVVRDDLGGLTSARGFAHYGVEIIVP